MAQKLLSMRVTLLLMDRIYLQTVIYFEIMIRCKQGTGVEKECLLQVPLDLFDVWNVLAVLLNGRPSYTLFSSMSRLWRDKVGIVGLLMSMPCPTPLRWRIWQQWVEDTTWRGG